MLLTAPIGCPPRFLGLDGIARSSMALADAASDAKATGERITAIAQLQQALAELAKAKQKSSIDPGPIGVPGGVVPDQTMHALAAALSSISPNDMPTWLRISLGVALGVGATTSTAKSFVASNASTLTKAVEATTIIVLARAAGKTPPTTAADTPFFATQGVWYKTWWGMGAIGVGVAGAIALLMSRRAPALPAAPAKAISGRSSRR